MASKTTVAIDDKLRKSIKKLAAWLDIPQGEVVRRAIKEFENSIFSGRSTSPEGERGRIDPLQARYQAATDHVWATDLKSKKIQQLLMRGPETIDDFILNDWNSGLEE